MGKKTFSTALPPWPILIIGAVCLLCISYYFFVSQVNHPTCCDADDYMKIAKNIYQDGIFETKSPLRTFAYPWLLSITLKLANALDISPLVIIFMMQLSAYFLVVLYAAYTFATHSPKLVSYVYIGMCLNFFVAPYFSVTLTDSIYTTIAILLLIYIIKINILNRSNFFELAFFSTMLSFLIVIRPASIWLIPPFLYVIGKLIYERKISIFLSLWILPIASIPLIFQAILNKYNFGIFTFFPIESIGSSQIQWGIENIKYATWLGSGSIQNFYTAENLVNIPRVPEGLSWYLTSPTDSIKLVIVKFIGGFDFDYLVPYPYKNPTYPWIASLISFTILIIATYCITVHFFKSNLTMLGDRILPLLILISWGSITLISALELRFVLVLITYFMIIASANVRYFLFDNRKSFHRLIAIWVVSMPLLINIAIFVRAQSINAPY